MTFDLPKRTEVDGAVSVCRPTEESLIIEATDNGVKQTMSVSRYNAARILAMLCMMLEIKPPKEIGKLPM